MYYNNYVFDSLAVDKVNGKYMSDRKCASNTLNVEAQTFNVKKILDRPRSLQSALAIPRLLWKKKVTWVCNGMQVRK